MAAITRWASPGKFLSFENDAASLAYADSIGYTLDVEPVAPQPVVVKTKLTKLAFQARFPKLANGVTTKYAAMDFFLSNDAYAASLTTPVSGAALIALRLLIVQGVTSMDLSGHVDLALPDAAMFTGLLAQPTIPVEFRLTLAERTLILTATVLPAEEYKGV